MAQDVNTQDWIDRQLADAPEMTPERRQRLERIAASAATRVARGTDRTSESQPAA